MSAFGAFLGRSSTTTLLQRMVADNRALDAREQQRALVDGLCLCGLAIRLHRDAANHSLSCVEARDRFFLLGEHVSQADQRIEAAACGAEVGGRHGEIAQGLEHVGVEGGCHALDSVELSGTHPREFAGETLRETESGR